LGEGEQSISILLHSTYHTSIISPISFHLHVMHRSLNLAQSILRDARPHSFFHRFLSSHHLGSQFSPFSLSDQVEGLCWAATSWSMVARTVTPTADRRSSADSTCQSSPSYFGTHVREQRVKARDVCPLESLGKLCQGIDSRYHNLPPRQPRRQIRPMYCLPAPQFASETAVGRS
jgi:hypothetical protein